MTSTATQRTTGARSSLAFKAPVRVATTANITLSAAQTIDGVACVDGDRVLVKNQTSGIDNGIYVVDGTSTWSRAPDCDGADNLVQGTLIFATSGTANSGFWYCSTSGTITVGTTSIAFTSAPGIGLSVITTLGDLIVGGASGVPQRLAAGTDTYMLTMSAGAPAWAASPAGGAGTIGAAVVTTSGTSVALAAGLGANLKGIDLFFRGVSTNGTSPLNLLLGTSGGLVSSNYIASYASGVTGTMTNAASAASAAFILSAIARAAADTDYGYISLRLINATTNTWSIEYTLGAASRSAIHWGSGEITLAAALTQISLTTTGGTDTFDAGAVVPVTYT